MTSAELTIVGTFPDLNAALDRLVDGVSRGKRRWLIARLRGGFAVLRPTPGGLLVCELPPSFQFTRTNRALLIAHARKLRMAVAEHFHGPAGNA